MDEKQNIFEFNILLPRIEPQSNTARQSRNQINQNS